MRMRVGSARALNHSAYSFARAPSSFGDRTGAQQNAATSLGLTVITITIRNNTILSNSSKSVNIVAKERRQALSPGGRSSAANASETADSPAWRMASEAPKWSLGLGPGR